MIVDLFLVYQFIRRLATPFEKWEAYKTGVIDEKGKILIKKKDRTDAQKKSWQIFDVMIANLKKLLAKVPGGSSRLASYVAALYLIREWNHFTDGTLLTEDVNEDDLEESLSVFNDLYVNYITEETNVKALITEAAAPRWKRAGPNGEKEITISTGRRFKIEKQLDHNERHHGEWKVMEWNKRNREWDWHETFSPQWYAKEKVMELGKYDSKGKKITESVDPHPEVVKAYKKTLDAEDQAGDYNHRSNKARVTRAANHLSKKIKQHHPDLDMKGKIALRTALQNMKENKRINTKPSLEETPVNSVGSGNIAGMDGSAFSKEAQKRWTSQNKSKKKKLRDMMGDKL